MTTGDPVSRTIPRLVGSLTNHVRRARQAHSLEALQHFNAG